MVPHTPEIESDHDLTIPLPPTLVSADEEPLEDEEEPNEEEQPDNEIGVVPADFALPIFVFPPGS